MDIWQPFIGTQYPKLDQAIDDFIERIRCAVDYDLARWPDNYTGSVDSRKLLMKQYLAEKVAYLTSEWGEGIYIEDGITSPMMTQETDTNWYTLGGRRLQAKPLTPGIYLNGKKKVVIR